MGRWSQYDEDSYRLPEGMKRIGYDADTGKYTFRDRDGSIWEGPEGAEFGEMTRVSGPPAGGSSHEELDVEDDIEAAQAPTHNGYAPLATDLDSRVRRYATPSEYSYRNLFPFFLLIGSIVLLIWRLVVYPTFNTPELCSQGLKPYWAVPGDSCWEIAEKHHVPFDKLIELNPRLNCDLLMPGTSMCLPRDESTKPTSVST
ncbi:hypothetical protein BDN72DRAFT_870467 [Pluteus cervinus]|uniref:Uncharacterized protein n=1 Tax=Pluteus cervinus TaxID=181527 RepID=A0ACD3AW82_9AGAR|nr:hypothetical protein BDN72DRAFT_870467 [Pluteus cervinus]